MADTKKDKSSDNVIDEVDLDTLEYVNKFLANYNGFVGGGYASTTLRNQIIKDLNMNPIFKDRDNVEKMVANPKYYEKQLRELSQYLENVSMPMKKIINYYANILDWDYEIIPYVDFDTMKTTAFTKAETRIYDWLDALNPKKSFKRLLKGSMIEDAKFYYYRESKNGVFLQEMPSDYCMITYQDEVSYRYSFDMHYFNKSGVDINGYAPEFKEYWLNNMPKKKAIGTERHWLELDPDKAFVFKFDIIKAGLTPPFIGLFVDAIEMDTYKNLKASKTALEAYKLIIGSIPRNKENKTGNKKDDFAISPAKAGQFASIVKNSVPDGVDYKVTPFEKHEMFEFSGNSSEEDIARAALKNLIDNSGSSQTLGIDKPTQSTVTVGKKVDESFVTHMYQQAEDFINFMLSKISPRYKFKIKFQGTIYDREDREKSAKDWAAVGVITYKIGAAMGYTPREFDQAQLYAQSKGYPDRFKPVQSAYQTNNKDNKNGRPEMNENDISDNGATAKDHEIN